MKTQRMMGTWAAILGATALMFAWVSLAGATVAIVNPDFETGPFADSEQPTGWTSSDAPYTGDQVRGAGAFYYNGVVPGQPNPNHAAYMNAWVGADGGVESLSQDISTFEVGQKYQVSFYLNADASRNDPTFNAYIGGVQKLHIADVVAVDPEYTFSTPFYFETFTFVATAATETLKFETIAANNSNAAALLDNISIEQVIPEPSLIALLGMGGFVLWLRRRDR